MDELRIFRGALSADEVALARARPGAMAGRRRRRRDDDDDGANDLLLVRVGRLARSLRLRLRARRDRRRIARVEERIVAVLEDAARDARDDRELAEQLRRTRRASSQRAARAHDAMSLDRKRSALTALADGLWNDLARELDDAAGRPVSGDAPPRRDGW